MTKKTLSNTTRTTLSTHATVYDAEGCVFLENVRVTLITDYDGGKYMRVYDTLYSLSDMMDERGLDDKTLADITEETERIFCCATGQTIIL